MPVSGARVGGDLAGAVLRTQIRPHEPPPESDGRQAAARVCRPLIPTLVEAPPKGGARLHEIKHDGYRTMLAVDGGAVRAFTRNGHDWSDRFARVCTAARRVTCQAAIIDGEIIVQNVEGISDFHALRSGIELGGKRLILFAFDLLHFDGRDLRGAPLVERRARLRDVIPADPSLPIQFSDHFEGEGAELLAAANRKGLEGIVSKRLDSRYRSGRSRAWLKTKCFQTGEFVVIGIGQEPKGPPVALLARDDGSGLTYARRAFIGLNKASRERLRKKLAALAVEKPPVPSLRKRSAQRVKPQLRVAVKHLKGTGGLRHASLIGFADDGTD